MIFRQNFDEFWENHPVIESTMVYICEDDISNTTNQVSKENIYTFFYNYTIVLIYMSNKRCSVHKFCSEHANLMILRMFICPPCITYIFYLKTLFVYSCRYMHFCEYCETSWSSCNKNRDHYFITTCLGVLTLTLEPDVELITVYSYIC